MTYDAKVDEIANNSWAMVKRINTNWAGGSAVKDLKTHYFDEPQMETMVIDIPFTRESWHGRRRLAMGPYGPAASLLLLFASPKHNYQKILFL